VLKRLKYGRSERNETVLGSLRRKEGQRGALWTDHSPHSPCTAQGR